MRQSATEIARARVRWFATRATAPPFHLQWWMLALAAIAFVFAFVAGQRSHVSLTFDVHSATPGSLQIFHAKEGAFSEMRAHIWPLQGASAEHVSITMPTREARILRLDPAPGMTEISMCDMRLGLSDGSSLSIPPSEVRATGETMVTVDSRCAVLTAAASALDPQASVNLSALAPALEREEQVGDVAARAWTAFGFTCFVGFLLLLRYGRRATGTDSGITLLGNALPYVYLIVALVFGTLLALVTPPGGVPDEPAHMAKVIMVENGRWLGAEGKVTTDPALSSVQGIFQDFLNPARHFSSAEVFAHASTPLRCSPSIESIPTSAANYSPTLYIPAAVVLNIACGTGATVGSFIYGGRLANLLVAVFLTFVGLQAAGSLRWPLFVVALFPMTLFEQASMTADSLTLGLSLCMIGLHAGLASGGVRPRWGVEALLLVVGLALAVSKPGYAWICVGFVFSFSAYRRVARGFAARAIILIVLPWIAHIGWIVFTAQDAVARAGIDPAANLAAVFQEPTETLALLSRTFLGPGKDFLWSSMVGLLGWLDVALHPASYALAAAAVTVSMLMRPSVGGVPDNWIRPLAVVIAVGAAMLPVIPMYLYWTPRSALLIEGLQGRYFLPAAAFLLVWLGVRGPLPMRAVGGIFILMAMLAVNIDAVYSLATRYYA